METNWSNISEPEKSPNDNRTLGLVILGLGLALAAWVVSIIYLLINGDGSREIINNLVPMESITITITSSSERMIVPESFFYVVGLFFCVLLLAICGSIGKALIAHGVRMLQPDIQGGLEKLRKEVLRQRRP